MTHAFEPLVTSTRVDGKWKVPAPKPWMAMFFHVERGAARPTYEEIAKLLNGVCKVRRMHLTDLLRSRQRVHHPVKIDDEPPYPGLATTKLKEGCLVAHDSALAKSIAAVTAQARVVESDKWQRFKAFPVPLSSCPWTGYSALTTPKLDAPRYQSAAVFASSMEL